MKKLLLILLLSIPVLGIAQNQIALKDGQKFIGIINSIYNNKILFKENIPGTDIYYIQAIDVYSLKGKISATRTKKLLKINPDLILIPGEITTEDYYNQPTEITFKPINHEPSIIINKSPGDLIKTSSILRLSGFAVGIGTSTLFVAGAFEDLDNDTQKTIGIVSGVVSLGLYIAGEITLFNAGKALNREAVTLGASSSGLGLAINF